MFSSWTACAWRSWNRTSGFENSQRRRLEEALARTGQGNGDDQSGPLVKAEPQGLTAGIWEQRDRVNDHEAARLTLTEIVGGAALASSAQTP